jgi:molybdopterin-guanine dinucleotide biosynthesis protein
MNPKIIVIAGTASNSGKTTLLCDLLRALTHAEKWEAIKLTRGHYRSCGKDPHACCVSDLLGAQPTVRSGRAATYAFGKDTGRYWDAGAANVHWVIATDQQVKQGINEALARVETGRVLIEGTSLLTCIKPNWTVLVAGEGKVKPSARRALLNEMIDAVYLNDDSVRAEALSDLMTGLPCYTRRELPQLLELLRSQV